MASSFDFAISKQTSWLLDMFGVDFHGTPVIKKIVSRINAERKRPGPVELYACESFLAPSSVQIYLDDKLVEDVITFERLIRWVEEKPTRNTDVSRHITFSRSGDRTQGSDTTIHASLFEWFSSEIAGSLSDSRVFSREAQRKLMSETTSHPLFRKSGGRASNFVHDVDWNLTGDQRIGVLHREGDFVREQFQDRPLTIAVCSGCAATLSIFAYLKHFAKLDLDVNCAFTSAAPINNIILGQEDNTGSEPPDVCVSNLSFLSQYDVRRSDYTPFMFLPKISHRVIRKRVAETKKTRASAPVYLFLRERAGSSQFYFSKLVDTGHFGRKIIAKQFSETHEAANIFKKDEESSMLCWFPNYCLFSSIFETDFIDPPWLADSHTFMFVHKSLLEEKQKLFLLNVSVRNAWLKLLAEPQLVNSVASLLLADRSYTEILRRGAGLFQTSMAP